MIIDAHHHLWAPQTDPGGVGYVWLRDIGAMKPFGDPTPIQRDYLLPEFRAEAGASPLAGSVHLQCDPKIPDPVAETAFVQGLSDASGFPIMIVGFADLLAEDAGNMIARHTAFANFRGLRQIISYLPDQPQISFAPRNLLDDPMWRARYAGLADHGLSFDLQLYPEQMLQAADLIAATPDVPVVIDHLGSPYDTSDAGLARWAAGMERLAALPHVSVKLGGYAMYFGAGLGALPARLTRQAIALFGPDRCMFGSNFPVDKLHLDYGGLMDFIRAEAGPHAEAIFGGNAARFYRFEGLS